MYCFHLHHNPLLFTPQTHSKTLTLTLTSFKTLNFKLKASSPQYAPDEVPVDEEFLAKFAPKEKESEESARRRNWIERGWAPWEEILTPEADFARKSLNEGEEVPLQSPEAIEAFKMLTPAYRRKVIEESGLTEEEYMAKQFAIKGEIPDKLETKWVDKLAVRMLAPRDWPPRGWVVDEEELATIRESHKEVAKRVDLDGVVEKGEDGVEVGRYRVFLKQYNEWVAANRDVLEEESYKFDQDYYPGRRKRGKDYKEEMLELPFIYPGQICIGKVVTLHLHQGAFIDIGCVHDGWVPIKGNDWYWIRHHVKVGMKVVVEVLAKRDPYRYRFPIEMRFVYPNIDHLIFRRFDFPPIFHREEDTNPELLWRETRRPPIPRKRPAVKPEDQSLLSDHPYVERLWQIHVAEQMILDDEERNPDKYKDKKLAEMTDNFDEENSVQYTKAYYKKALLPKKILNTNLKELDLDAARAERQLNNKLKKEAAARGEQFKIEKLRRNIEMDEYDFMHWRRSLEEREALLRDISCRKAVGLPVEEPGRYDIETEYSKGRYDPTNPLYRYDYWGEPKNSEKSKQERKTDDHNKAIVGKGNVWYEMSYEEAIKQKEFREVQIKKKPKETEEKVEEAESIDDDDDDDLDFDYSILGSVDDNENSSSKPVVNGTESPRLSEEGLFGN